MTTVTKRELNQHTADVLARVTDGEDVVVTERGRPRWRICVVGEDVSFLERLERDGLFVPPSANPTPWPSHPGGPTYTDAQVTNLLDEMRGEH
ncbi:MAG: type II toxin-antitoxin system prevent-host-death family antitoxin [Tetrasphaera sp.]